MMKMIIMKSSELTEKQIFENIKEARKIIKKGWYVKCSKCSKRGNGYTAHDATGKKVGDRKDLYEALGLAISSAFKAGTLNWEKTVRYCRLRFGITVTYDYVTGDFSDGSSRMGWSISKSRKCEAHEVYLMREKGTRRVYIGSRPTVKKAVTLAIETAKKRGTYHKPGTVRWLKKHNLEELISIT